MNVTPPHHLLRFPLSALPFALLASEALAAKPARALDSLYVVAVQGTAWHFQSADSGSGVNAVPLKSGDKLAIGSRVGTGEGGMMRLLLAGHTVVDLTPQSVVGFPGTDR